MNIREHQTGMEHENLHVGADCFESPCRSNLPVPCRALENHMGLLTGSQHLFGADWTQVYHGIPVSGYPSVKDDRC